MHPATLLFLAAIAAVIWAALPSCRRESSRWWLVATMVAVPWLAWAYWLPRAIRYRVERRRRLYEIVAPIPGGVLVYSDRSIHHYRPERRAHRRQRRQEARVGAAPTDRRESVRFWSERHHDGTPTERAIAPEMLALLRESRADRDLSARVNSDRLSP